MPGIFIPGFGHLFNLHDLLIHRFKVPDLKFKVNDFFIPDWINRSFNVGHHRIIKATDHMDQGIYIADIGKEFIAFILASSFGKTREYQPFRWW